MGGGLSLRDPRAAPASLAAPLPPMLRRFSHSARTLNVCRTLFVRRCLPFFVCAGRAPVVSVHAYDEAVDRECHLNVDAEQQQGQDLAAGGGTGAGEKDDGDAEKEGIDDDTPEEGEEEGGNDDAADVGKEGKAARKAVRSSKKKRAGRIDGSLGPPSSKRAKKQQGQRRGDRDQVGGGGTQGKKSFF